MWHGTGRAGGRCHFGEKVRKAQKVIGESGRGYKDQLTSASCDIVDLEFNTATVYYPFCCEPTRGFGTVFCVQADWLLAKKRVWVCARADQAGEADGR
jgi:hypothetical protein